MLSRKAFTERFGDPGQLIFKGQFYHSGTPAECGICGHRIRNVYTLHSQGRSLRSGECCFSLLQKLNPTLGEKLHAARVLLGVVEDGFKHDVKVYNAKGDVDYRLREWRKLKAKAMKVIRDYKKAEDGDWLPKPLYFLKAEASRKPGKTSRWFDRHIPVLRDKLNVEN